VDIGCVKRVTRETIGLFAGIHQVSLTQAIAAQDDQEAWEESGAEVFATHFVDLLAGISKSPSNRASEMDVVVEMDAEKSPQETADALETELLTEDHESAIEFVITRPQKSVVTPRPSREENQTAYANMLLEAEMAGVSLLPN
jgi:hypothetical protein